MRYVRKEFFEMVEEIATEAGKQLSKPTPTENLTEHYEELADVVKTMTVLLEQTAQSLKEAYELLGIREEVEPGKMIFNDVVDAATILRAL